MCIEVYFLEIGLFLALNKVRNITPHVSNFTPRTLIMITISSKTFLSFCKR